MKAPVRKMPPVLPVESATHHGLHNGVSYQIAVWKPQGRLAFVYSVAVPGDSRVLPPIPDAATTEEAISAGVQYATELIDG